MLLSKFEVEDENESGVAGAVSRSNLKINNRSRTVTAFSKESTGTIKLDVY
jgi:hypothetical protein